MGAASGSADQREPRRTGASLSQSYMRIWPEYSRLISHDDQGTLDRLAASVESRSTPPSRYTLGDRSNRRPLCLWSLTASTVLCAVQ